MAFKLIPARRIHILSRYAIHGYRPSTPFIVNLLADSSKNAPWQQALVQTLEAIQLHTPVPIEVGCSILERAMSYPSDPMYTNAVKKLTDSMLFSTAGISSLAGRQAASVEGEERMQGGPTAWSDAQVSVLVQALAHFNLYDRAELVAEHFALRGWRPTSAALGALFRSCAWKIGAVTSLALPEAQALLRWSQNIAAAARVEPDPALACGMLELLLRPVALRRARSDEEATNTGYLDAAFEFLAALPLSVLSSAPVLQKVVHFAVQLGHPDKALNFLSALRSKRITPPTACFNELLRGLDASSVQQAHYYMRFMQELAVRPDERTVIALLRLHFLSGKAKESGALTIAEITQQLCDTLNVQLSSAIVGYAAHNCLHAGRAGEYVGVLRLLERVARPAGVGTPRWLQKLNNSLAAATGSAANRAEMH